MVIHGDSVHESSVLLLVSRLVLLSEAHGPVLDALAARYPAGSDYKQLRWKLAVFLPLLVGSADVVLRVSAENVRAILDEDAACFIGRGDGARSACQADCPHCRQHRGC